jgi:hypothetical protein
VPQPTTLRRDEKEIGNNKGGVRQECKQELRDGETAKKVMGRRRKEEGGNIHVDRPT